MNEPTLKVGDPFPRERLDGLAGDGPAVVYFYPAAATPGCTIEAHRFNERYDAFREAGVEVIGVSVDPDEANRCFAEDEGLRFPLVSDPTQELTQELGLLKDYGEYGMLARRVTFLLDRDGVVRHIWPVNDVESHADEVLAAAKELA